jgi:hypothetical protein
MADETDTLEVVARVPVEANASLIVQFLADHGIEATQVGGFTSVFKAEAPGWCSVVVKHNDLERAKAALKEAQHEWSLEEVDEAEVVAADEAAPAEEPLDEDANATLLEHLWWLIAVVGLSFAVTGYLFTRSIPLLNYSLPIILLLALAAYLAGRLRR